jgi:hypothetical protein
MSASSAISAEGRVVIIGGGGREHALAFSLHSSGVPLLLLPGQLPCCCRLLCCHPDFRPLPAPLAALTRLLLQTERGRRERNQRLWRAMVLRLGGVPAAWRPLVLTGVHPAHQDCRSGH